MKTTYLWISLGNAMQATFLVDTYNNYILHVFCVEFFLTGLSLPLFPHFFLHEPEQSNQAT